MMNKIFLLLIFGLSYSYCQENIHNKKRNTLVEFSEIITHFEKLEEESGNIADISLNALTPGYLLLVKNTNQIRKIPPSRLIWLKGVFKAFKFDHKVEDLFENEILIKTKEGTYWLPIQKELLGFWKDELKLNDQALIYIRAYGSIKDSPKEKWLFTINAFNSGFYDGLWSEVLKSFNDKDSNNGLNCIDKLIELNPNDGRNYSALGYYYYDADNSNIDLLNKADSLYTKAIKLSPDYSHVYYQKALVKMKLKEYEKAWENIEIARKLGKKNMDKRFIEQLEENLSHSDYLKKQKN